MVKHQGFNGRLHLDVAQAELTAVANRGAGGYRSLYVEHVLQADQGCDFDFLVGCRGADMPRHSH